MAKSQYFTTSDGQQFYIENTARNHAKSLTDKTVTPPGEEIVNVEDIEVDAEEVNSETKVDINDYSQTGEAISEKMFGIDAKADGSQNILVVGDIPGNLPKELPAISAEETAELIKSGGQKIENVDAPVIKIATSEEKNDNKPNTKK